MRQGADQSVRSSGLRVRGNGARRVGLEGEPGRVVILGGGLAGIAAAVRLAQGGAAVHLIETRKRLGGRATSFSDPETGRTLDNCQHVLMGCCTNLLDLYRRLGVSDRIAWHERLYFASVRGQVEPVVDTLEADDLPAPMHMSGALMGFQSLTLFEKLAIARAMVVMMRLGAEERAALHDQSFAAWLESHHQPRGAVDKFWRVIVVSALNEELDQAAADYAIQVFQEGFLANENAYLMGLSKGPLVELYDSAAEVIRGAGGEVSLGVAAEELVFEDGRVGGVRTSSGEVIEGDYVLSALPFDRLAKLCSVELLKADDRLRRLDRFTVSPILGIHLWFDAPADRAVMDLPHLVLIDSPLQWIFNKGVETREAAGLVAMEEAGEAVSGANGRPTGMVQHLHGVISAAHEWVDQHAERILEMAAREVRRALPRARGAELAHGKVIKEKRATFSCRPGVDRLRPAARGAIGNLMLAGDWCQSGWPATMEGAVRSGYIAAGAILDASAGAPARTLVADLPVRPLYRLVGKVRG